MMNFSNEHTEKAGQLLNKIFSLISPLYIEENITSLPDAITEVLIEKQSWGYSHENFHKTITEYIQTVSDQSKLYGGRLSKDAAHSEAVFLINNFYNGLHYKGMDGALDDAFNKDYDPMELTIRNLNKALKEYFQIKHFESVRRSYIDAVDSPIRCAMTKILVLQKRIMLIPPMDTWSIDQLSGRLWQFIRQSPQL